MPRRRQRRRARRLRARRGGGGREWGRGSEGARRGPAPGQVVNISRRGAQAARVAFMACRSATVPPAPAAAAGRGTASSSSGRSAARQSPYEAFSAYLNDLSSSAVLRTCSVRRRSADQRALRLSISSSLIEGAPAARPRCPYRPRQQRQRWPARRGRARPPQTQPTRGRRGIPVLECQRLGWRWQ